MNYCIIADYFQEDFLRGAELNLSALIENLRPNHKITTRRSHTITADFINDNDYTWIVSNRMNLSEAAKKALSHKRYYIIENDSAWLSTRNFGLYEDFIPPPEHIVDKEFYEGAVTVVMQSKVHEYAIKQALHLKNTVCSNGNSWSKADLALFRELAATPKTEGYAVLMSGHPSKGTKEAVEFCINKGFDYKIIPEMPRPQYLTELAKFQFLVFLPSVFESYSRVCAEFRVLGGTVLSNNKVAFNHEEHAQLKGLELIDFMKSNNSYIASLFQE